MSESDLYKLPIDELFDLLMKSTKELIDFHCTEHELEYEEKKKEVQLIQRFIVAKRAGFHPLV